MIKLSPESLEKLESQYPGILDSIRQQEVTPLPSCPHCFSEDTATVGVGCVGPSLALASATTRYRLIPNGPKPGSYYCNTCSRYFDR